MMSAIEHYAATNQDAPNPGLSSSTFENHQAMRS